MSWKAPVCQYQTLREMLGTEPVAENVNRKDLLQFPCSEHYNSFNVAYIQLFLFVIWWEGSNTMPHFELN
jgi:hypothetical protein